MLQGVASLGPLRRCRIDLDARRLFSAGWLENVLDRGGGYPRICWMSAFRRKATLTLSRQAPAILDEAKSTDLQCSAMLRTTRCLREYRPLASDPRMRTEHRTQRHLGCRCR